MTELMNKIMEITRECGEIMLNADRSPEMVESKEGQGNFVTTYDKQVQKTIREKLLALLPEAKFVGEEEEEHARVDEGYVFVVDPIDGTANFIRDFKLSAISVGLLKDGEPFLGVVYEPYLNEMFVGQKGQGAYLNGKPIHCSSRPLSEGIVMVGSCPYYKNLQKKSMEIAFDYFQKALDIRRSGSAAWDICCVACGRAELFFELVLNPWDYCAACTILAEAGGKITTMEDTPILFDRQCSVKAWNGAAEV